MHQDTISAQWMDGYGGHAGDHSLDKSRLSPRNGSAAFTAINFSLRYDRLLSFSFAVSTSIMTSSQKAARRNYQYESAELKKVGDLRLLLLLSSLGLACLFYVHSDFCMFFSLEKFNYGVHLILRRYVKLIIVRAIPGCVADVSRWPCGLVPE